MKRILFILHLPPPYHGPGVMGNILRENGRLNQRFECHFVNLSTSESLDEIGQGGIRKLVRIIHLYHSVKEMIGRVSPDVVYLTPTSGFPGILKDWFLVRLARRGGRKVLVHLHNKGVEKTRHRIFADAVFRDFFRSLDVILLSDRLYPDIARYVSRERVHICPNGIPYSSGGLSGGRTDPPSLLFLSNLLISKGILDYLDACRILLERAQSFQAVIAGAPTAEMSVSQLVHAIDERGLSEHVRYVGGSYGDAKEALLRSADILVHPTCSDCFPLVILEAMSHGLPVITTAQGAIPDEVIDGETGILCPEHDPTALCAAVERLLSDRDLRQAMGIKARERYKMLFTQDTFIDRMMAIIAKVLETD